MSPGAPALLAVFVWLSSPEVLGAVLLAALCHELGHYAALRRHGDSARALQSAQREFLAPSAGGQSHPFYWGAFYLARAATQR